MRGHARPPAAILLRMSFAQAKDRARFSPEKLCKENLFESEHMFCDLYGLEPGQSQKAHAHEGATKFYYVIEGEGRFTIGSRTEVLGPGGIAWVLPGEPHGVENASASRLVLLVAMAPNPNAE